MNVGAAARAAHMAAWSQLHRIKIFRRRARCSCNGARRGPRRKRVQGRPRPPQRSGRQAVPPPEAGRSGGQEDLVDMPLLQGLAAAGAAPLGLDARRDAREAEDVAAGGSRGVGEGGGGTARHGPGGGSEAHRQGRV
jgi:hypothetical protein